MSYREDPQANPEICGVPTHVKIHLLNGTTTELAITCSYVIPASPENAQVTYEPIHLTAEGYDAPDVSFAPHPGGLLGDAWIDEEDDSIVRCVFNAQCASAITEDVECDVSVRVSRDTGAHGVRTDCILRGTIEIEDAPLTETPEM